MAEDVAAWCLWRQALRLSTSRTKPPVRLPNGGCGRRTKNVWPVCVGYYNARRSHQGPDQDSPLLKAVSNRGLVCGRNMLGSIMHDYCRWAHLALKSSLGLISEQYKPVPIARSVSPIPTHPVTSPPISLSCERRIPDDTPNLNKAPGERLHQFTY